MLKQRAIAATLWSGADILLRQGLQFGVSVVLARILSPVEFGTIALLYLFTGIASAFVDGGFSTALIRDREASHTDESTVFWFNLVIGACLAAVLALSANAIAAFYELPILVPLTWAMATNVFMSALGSIHGTLLTRDLNFRVQMKIGVAASLLSGAVAIGLAWRGFGVWALAAQAVVATLCTTVLLWVVNPWRPTQEFSVKSVRRLFGFGGFVLASSLLDILYSRLHTVVIGKLFGVRELGYFHRADGIKQLPVGVLTSILGRVALPVFSAVADDTAKLRRGVTLSVRGMMLLNLPIMMGLAALADPFVTAVLGAQWLPSSPLLQILCLAGSFWPLHVINLSVLMALGHSNLFFRLQLVKQVLGIGLLCVGALFGVRGIAWSSVAFGACAFPVNAFYTKRFLGYGVVEQTIDFAPCAALSGVMFVAVRSVSRYWSPSPIVETLLLAIFGAVVFVGLGFLLRMRVFRDAVGLVKEHGPFRRSVRID